MKQHLAFEEGKLHSARVFPDYLLKKQSARGSLIDPVLRVTIKTAADTQLEQKRLTNLRYLHMLSTIDNVNSRDLALPASMTVLSTIYRNPIPPFIIIAAAFISAGSALAQSSPNSALFTSLATVPAPLLFSPIQGVIPGFAGPPPGAGRMFHGEVKYRLLYVTPRGAVENSTSGEKLDLRSGLGYPKELMVLESMSRVQMGRYSARAHLDTYSTGFTGAGSRLDWPEFRVGGDVDLINIPGLRLGGNVDYYLKSPKFVLNDSDIGSTAFETLKPTTAGIHVGYNSPGSIGTSWSFDARWRISVTESLKFDEAEAAIGFKTPDTMLGKAALRGGYRYMAVGLANNPFRVDFAWNAAFLELVCFY